MADILEYDAADAAARFDELLDQIERGPQGPHHASWKGNRAASSRRQRSERAEVAEAIERLKALREQVGKAPLDEVLASIHEGHKY